jgi:hypothetical protein
MAPHSFGGGNQVSKNHASPILERKTGGSRFSQNVGDYLPLPATKQQAFQAENLTTNKIISLYKQPSQIFPTEAVYFCNKKNYSDKEILYKLNPTSAPITFLL